MALLGLPRRGDAAVIGEWLAKAGYIDQVTTRKKDPRFADSKNSFYTVIGALHRSNSSERVPQTGKNKVWSLMKIFSYIKKRATC